MIIWAAISWYSAGLTLSGRITASDYVDILGNQLHPDRLCGLVVRVSGYRYRGLGFDSRRYQIF